LYLEAPSPSLPHSNIFSDCNVCSLWFTMVEDCN
jgi:hypothetical protein